MNRNARTFLIHVHPERFGFMSEADVLEIANLMTLHWPERCSVSTGDDDGRYVNIRIESLDADETWRKIEHSFLGEKLPGGEFRIASIITATGAADWDDYLLLHHYDPGETRDPYPNRE